MKAIVNGQIVTETGIIWDGVILLSGDTILKVGKASEVTIPDGVPKIDANGAYVGPGFVDIHVHAGGAYDLCFEPIQAAEYFLCHGTTTLLATTSYNMPYNTFLDAIRSVKTAMEKTPVIKGLYLEGPYMNPKYGARADLNPWRGPIDETQFHALVDEAGEDAKVWAIAPEREGIISFLEYARKVNPEVVFAVGHSEATPAQIRALGKYKPTLQTHSTNATGRLPVPGGTRGIGPDEYCFCEPDVYTELISDSCAVHVSAEMQQLLLHNKGVHRVVLITDSTSPANENPPELAHVTDLNFDHLGGLSGSRMTMEQACRNIMQSSNCGIAQAFLMASTNPAKVIGLGDEIGSIAPGKKADLVFVDDKFCVKSVILGGKRCEF